MKIENNIPQIKINKQIDIEEEKSNESSSKSNQRQPKHQHQHSYRLYCGNQSSTIKTQLNRNWKFGEIIDKYPKLININRISSGFDRNRTI